MQKQLLIFIFLTLTAFLSAQSPSSLSQINADLNTRYPKADSLVYLDSLEIMRLTNEYITTGDYTKILELSRRATLFTGGQLNDMANSLGRGFFKAGKLKEALKFYKDHTKYFPSDPRGWYAVGVTYENLDSIAQSVINYEKALSLDSMFTQANAALADYYTKKEAFVKSCKYADRVFEMDSSSAETYINQSCNYYFLKKYDDALYCLKKYRQINPADSSVTLKMTGKIYLAMEDYWQALPWLLKGKRDFPDSAQNVLKDIGLCYYKKYNYSRSLDYYKEYLMVDSNDTVALMRAGDCCTKLNDYPKAHIYYSKFYALDSNSYNANSKMGISYQNHKLYDKADFYFRKCAIINPEEPFTPYRIGLLFFDQEKYQEAINSYQEALKLDSLYGCKADIAQAFYKMKKYKLAIEYYSQAIAEDSTVMDSYNELADVYADSSLYSQAVKYYQIALNRREIYRETYLEDKENNEKIADILASLSWYYLLNNQVADAEKIALKAFSQNMGFISTKINLAHAILLQNRYDEALEYYEYLLNPKRDNLDGIKKSILKDFDDLEKHNITHPDFAKIKAMIK